MKIKKIQECLRSVLKSDRKLLLIIGCTLFAYITIGLNGFSIPIWDEILGEPPTSVILSGKTRGVRSDDYLSSAPMALSQVAHQPPFPVVNTLIGDGENMLFLPYAPEKHFLGFFLPHTWGFFIGPNTGLSWWWAWRMGGVFLGALLFCRIIFGRESLYQLVLPTIFLYSPFVQFWSGNAGEMIFHGFIVSASLYGLLTSQKTWKILACGLLLGYCACAEAFLLYPAYAIPIAYAALAIAIALVCLHGKPKQVLHLLKWRIVAATLAGCMVLGVGYLFWEIVKDPIQTMLHTSYPGKRVSLGGDFSIVDMFSAWTVSERGVYNRLLAGNICEGAFFFFVSPLIILLFIYDFGFKKLKPKQAYIGFLALTLCFLFIFAWSVIGFPEGLAKISMLTMVPGRRSVIGLGILDFAILCFYLSRQKPTHEKAPVTKGRIILLATLVTSTLIYLMAVSKRLPVFSAGPIAISLVVVTIIGAAFIFRRFRLAIGILLALSVRNTFYFNPIVWHGAESLTKNSVIKRIQEDQRDPGNENNRWLVVDLDPEASMLRAGGVRALNGYHFVPQNDLWKRVDPDRKYFDKYNRYANVKARLIAGNEVSFVNDAADSFQISLNPSRINAEKLAFNRILAPCESHRDLLNQNGWVQFAAVRRYCMWKLQ